MTRFLASVAVFATLLSTSIAAQEITYHLPLTEVRLDITYEVTVAKQGVFYQYSERYLGTKDVVTHDKTSYRLVNVAIGTTAVADLTRTYTFVPGQPGLNTFCLTRDGLLQSINDNDKQVTDKRTDSKRESAPKCDKSVMPLSEEVLLTGSTAKMAEGTAKQIYRLREARLNLLSGDVDKMPADAGSMKQVLQEIEAQEQQLTSLFIGTIKKEIRHERIIVPLAALLGETATDEQDDDKETIAFRFSSLSGVVAVDDLSGTPYYIAITDIYRPQKPISEKKAPALSPIYYCVPGSATFSISDGTKTISNNHLYLSSLGYVTALPADFIKTSPELHFDRRTGAIISAQ